MGLTQNPFCSLSDERNALSMLRKRTVNVTTSSTFTGADTHAYRGKIEMPRAQQCYFWRESCSRESQGLRDEVEQ